MGSPQGPLALGRLQDVEQPTFAVDSGPPSEAPPPPPVLCLRCGAPTPSSVGPQSVHIRWVPPVRESGPEDLSIVSFNYSVHVQQVDVARPVPNDNEWREVLCTPTLECQVISLRPGRSYALRITAHPSLVVAPDPSVAVPRIDVVPSTATIITTLPTAPSAPGPPALASRERKALKLKWNPPEETGGKGPLTYSLYMAPAPQEWDGYADAEGFVEVYRGDERALKVAKLLPGTRYTFKLKAYNPIGESKCSMCSSFTTQATVPAQPQPPYSIAQTQTSITLQWLPPPDNGSPVTCYTLEREEEGAGGEFAWEYAGPATQHTVKGLRSGVRYRFRLRADNDEGKSLWSVPATLCCAASAPSSPAAPAVVGATRTSATLSWSAPGHDGGAAVGGYGVELQARSKAAEEHMGTEWLPIFQGEATACTINSLRPGCCYRARVRAYSSDASAGWGAWSVPVDLTTAPDVPEPPGPPAILVSGSEALTLQWHPPLHNNGAKITGYTVEMEPGAGSGAGAQGPGGLANGGAPGSSGHGQHHRQQQHPHEHHHHQQQQQQQQARVVYTGEQAVARVEGLSPGSVYRFRVHAVNSQGLGPWSDWGVLATVPDLPLAPGAPVASATGSSSVAVRWAAPDGRGAAIAAYVVEYAPADAVQQQQQQQQAGEDAAGQQPVAAVADEASGSDTPSAPGGKQQPAQQGRQAAAAAPAGVAKQRTGSLPAAGAAAAAAETAAAARDRAGSAPPAAAAPSCWQVAYKGPALSADVRGLSPASSYLIRVAAVNAVGQGPWSAPAGATTSPAAPTEPVCVHAEALSAHETRVRWAAPVTDHGSAVTSYQVELSGGPVAGGAAATGSAPASAAWQQVAVVQAAAGAGGAQGSGGVHEAHVDRLLPGRSYQLRVRAVNACGVSPPSASAPLTTHAAPPAPPAKLSVVQRGATFAKIKWDEPAEDNGAEVEGYAVELSGGSSSSGAAGGEWRAVYTGKEQTTRVSDLQPGTKYWLRASATNTAGTGQPSQPEAFTTMLAPPGPPEDVSVSVEDSEAPADAGSSSSGGSGVLVRWQPPAAERATAAPASYEVCALPASASSSSAGHNEGDGASGPVAQFTGSNAVKVVVGRVCECRLERLVPGVRYAVRVRAVGAEGAGHGMWSAEAIVTAPGGADGGACALPLPSPHGHHHHHHSDHSDPAAAGGAALPGAGGKKQQVHKRAAARSARQGSGGNKGAQDVDDAASTGSGGGGGGAGGRKSRAPSASSQAVARKPPSRISWWGRFYKEYSIGTALRVVGGVLLGCLVLGLLYAMVTESKHMGMQMRSKAMPQQPQQPQHHHQQHQPRAQPKPSIPLPDQQRAGGGRRAEKGGGKRAGGRAAAASPRH